MTAYGIKKKIKGRDPHTDISRFKQMQHVEGMLLLLGPEVYFHLLGFKAYSKKKKG